MANKRIQKKRAKAAAHRKRIKMVADLTVFLCPDGTRYEKRRMGLALWKRSDDEITLIYLQESLRRLPLRRMIPRKVYDAPVAQWRPINAFAPSAIDRLLAEVRK